MAILGTTRARKRRDLPAGRLRFLGLFGCGLFSSRSWFAKTIEAAQPPAVLTLPAPMREARSALFPLLESQAARTLAGLAYAGALAVRALSVSWRHRAQPPFDERSSPALGTKIRTAIPLRSFLAMVSILSISRTCNQPADAVTGLYVGPHSHNLAQRRQHTLPEKWALPVAADGRAVYPVGFNRAENGNVTVADTYSTIGRDGFA